MSAVLGGGISGLSTAYYLSKSLRSPINVYESTERLGGWIKTTKNKNGTLFEHGPRTLRCSGIPAINTLQLINELGIFSLIKPVSKSSPAARNRMIYFNNQLITLPNSWKALFKINPPFIKPFVYAILKDLTTSKKVVTDESIHDFVSRRFGEKYADIPLSAMICGIFAGDAKEISVKALMRGLFEGEQKHGSAIGGMLYSVKNKLHKKKLESSDEFMLKQSKEWSVWSLQNGLEALPKCLANYLNEKKNIKVHVKSQCTNISLEDNKVQLTINGKTETVEHIFSCLPSKDLAKILGHNLSELKKELLSIPFVSVAVVNLEYEGELIDKDGFGFLVPPNQNLPILGVIFDSCVFPQKGKTVLTVMMGGKWFDKHFKENIDDEKFLEIAQDHVSKILKIDKSPTNSSSEILKECIPQYIVGHFERVERIRKFIAEKRLPLTLIGNSYDGVGVNDAIYSARKGVESALKIMRT